MAREYWEEYLKRDLSAKSNVDTRCKLMSKDLSAIHGENDKNEDGISKTFWKKGLELANPWKGTKCMNGPFGFWNG